MYLHSRRISFVVKISRFGYSQSLDWNGLISIIRWIRSELVLLSFSISCTTSTPFQEPPKARRLLISWTVKDIFVAHISIYGRGKRQSHTNIMRNDVQIRLLCLPFLPTCPTINMRTLLFHCAFQRKHFDGCQFHQYDYITT